MEEMEVTTLVGIAAFIAGGLFGGIANKSNFCTMGALSDYVYMGNKERLRAWMLAVAVAILGSQYMHIDGMVNLDESIYMTSNLGWFGAILGGILFGYGMTKAGGCGNKTLVRLGAGNLKSFVVMLVMGIVAYMTLRGLTGLVRVNLESASNVDLTDYGLSTQGLPEMVSTFLGLDPDVGRYGVIAIVAGGLLFWCFKDATFRGNKTLVLAGVAIGLLTVAGWWITGVYGYDDFDPTALMSFTFVGPSGESIQYLMTFTGSTINFGVATVGGVIFGSFLVSLISKTFKVEAFSGKDDMMSHIIGAAMMGFGGVVALGCTIGQGITGMSTLALGSVIALVSIIFGAIWGLKAMEEESIVGGLKAVFQGD